STSGFLFVRMPARILGLPTLLKNHQSMKLQFNQLRDPICPKCSQSPLVQAIEYSDAYPEYEKPQNFKEFVSPRKVEQEQIVEPNDGLIMWQCPTCQYGLRASPNRKELISQLLPEAHQIALDRLSSMPPAERLDLENRHYKKANLFKFISILLLLWGAYHMVVRHPIASLELYIFAIGCFGMALKWGFRAWQLRTGNIYVSNPSALFKTWITTEKWFSK
ncbi:MAG: hypothetical protein KGM39_07165, partial [Actinomycetales bacterium]|nr:hypothetical protein [Actinomycetales bacterium]